MNRLFDALAVAFVFVLLITYVSKSHAEDKIRMVVAQLNANTRIVLTNQLCDEQNKELGWKGMAQHLNEAGKVQLMRACWTREPHKDLIRLLWIDSKAKEPDNFSILDADLFQPVQ